MNALRSRQSGATLALVLVLTGVTALILSSQFLPVSSGLRFGSFLRNKATLENLAESGLELAKADLDPHMNALDFAQNFTPPGSTAEVDVVDAGYLYSPDRPNVVPRIAQERHGLRLRVFYHPAADNKWDTEVPPDPQLPRKYRVVSVAQNPQTGAAHTVEAELFYQNFNFAEITFGVLHPRSGSSVCSFTFAPATYEGHVHFGEFQAYNASGVGDNCLPSFAHRDHRFLGPVTFKRDVPKPLWPPYYGEMRFEKGYKTGKNIDAPADGPLFGTLRSIAEEADGLEKLHIRSGDPSCLKFRADNGCVDIHHCVTSQLENHPTAMVEATLNNHSERYGDRVDQFCPGGQPALIFADEDVEIKGVVSGNFTVASDKKVILAGWVRYGDQSADSSDKLGVLARTNIEVPDNVQGNGRDDDWRNYVGVTHFPVENDRFGTGNFDVSTLRLDGVYFAVGREDSPTTTGTLRIANLAHGNSFEDEVPGVNGKLYSLDPSKPNYLYVTTKQGVLLGRVSDTTRTDGRAVEVEPLYCGQNHADGTCALGTESMRPTKPNVFNLKSQIQVFGGTIVKIPTHKSAYFRGAWVVCRSRDADGNCVGGQDWYYVGYPGERQVKYDRRIGLNPPPAFPATAEIKRTELWRKSYPGAAALLTSSAAP